MLAAIKAKVTLGPKPDSVADGRPYSLKLSNPDPVAVAVTVKHEGGETTLTVPARGDAALDLVAAAGKPPTFVLASAVEAK